MEIDRSPKPKHLHKHTLPIVIVSAGVLLCSLIGYNYYASGLPPTSLRRALTYHLLSIHPERSGLARFTIARPTDPAQPATKHVLNMKTVVTDSSDSLGRTAQLGIGLQ
jgi:hypothetical protein